MCTIRLIQKLSDFQVNDISINLKDIHINPIDKPAYISYIYEDNIFEFEFIFSSDKEERNQSTHNDILIEYGVNSGRIYYIKVNKSIINQTDIFNIINNVKSKSATERFKDNIKCFIDLCNKILGHVINIGTLEH